MSYTVKQLCLQSELLSEQSRGDVSAANTHTLHRHGPIISDVTQRMLLTTKHREHRLHPIPEWKVQVIFHERTRTR